MLSEVAVAGIYLPPFFVYACIALPLYFVLRFVLAYSGVLRFAWHPALLEFAVSASLVSLLILHA